MDANRIQLLMLCALALLLALTVCSLVIIFRAKAESERSTRVGRLLRIWLPTACVGLGGLGVGLLRFPDSNLLGGYALVFGPLWMLAGPVVLVLAVLHVRDRRLKASRPA